ncbi:MAG TPA: PRC-barrel domain-containing protein [Azospirillum sp.]|nr:PRC-barrel domain-containing protein [Azospirillum sp.]
MNPVRILAAGIAAAAFVLSAASPSALPAHPIHTAADTVTLDDWDYRAAYSGWRASGLIDAVVFGANGEELGEVKDLLVDADGRLRALAIEASGMLDIGPALFTVPWRDAAPGPEPDTVTLPITAEEATALARADTPDTIGPGGWRVQALLGRPVHVAGMRHFGTVDDIIFDTPGAIVAAVVAPRNDPNGPYAYPWRDATLGPAQSALVLPVAPAQLRALGPFDYGRMPDGALARR